MGRAGIISIDGHVKAPRQAYRDYIDKKYRQTFDEWVRAAEGKPDGFFSSEIGAEAQWDVPRRIRDLETQGVVAEVIFPNGAAFQRDEFDFSVPESDRELSRQGLLSYNRWLVDFCSQAPERFAGLAMLSFDDVDLAVKDIYWAKEHGLRGVVMPGLYPGERFYFDPALDPVWAACQEVGFALSQHGGAGAPSYQPPGMAAILTLAYEQAFYAGRALWQMIVGGVFDRFPDLKVAFVETQAYWIGQAFEQFDRRIKMTDDWTEYADFLQRERVFRRLPSEYWATNFYAGISPFHPGQLPLDKLGSRYDAQPGEFAIRSDQAMFGVDYPHFESIFPSAVGQVKALVAEPNVTEEDTRRVLFGNAAEIYDFDVEALQPHVDRVGLELDDLVADARA